MLFVIVLVCCVLLNFMIVCCYLFVCIGLGFSCCGCCFLTAFGWCLCCVVG